MKSRGGEGHWNKMKYKWKKIIWRLTRNKNNDVVKILWDFIVPLDFLIIVKIRKLITDINIRKIIIIIIIIKW